MSFIKDKFFGGAEKEAGKRQAEAAGIAAETRAAGFRGAVAPRVGGLESAAQVFGETLRGGREDLGIDEFVAGGRSSFQQQLAQSGALGPEAQQAFFDQFNISPATEFRLGEARRFVESGGAEFGGLGGGNRLRRLQEIGLGLIQEDLTTQFNQLGTLTGRGIQAAGLGVPLLQQEAGGLAGIETSIGEARARGIEGAAGVEALGTQEAAAARAAGLLGQAGAVRGTVFDIAELIAGLGTPKPTT